MMSKMKVATPVVELEPAKSMSRMDIRKFIKQNRMPAAISIST